MKESNILLANFLGLELQEDNTYFDYESWDMLMLIVEKIKTLKRNGNYHYKRLMNMPLEQALNRDYVYDVCVEFVEWWNKENN